MACSSHGEEHFYRDNQQDRGHGNKTGHGRVSFVPEVGEAWVCQRHKRCRQKVDECGCDQNAGTEMSGEEEESMGDRKLGKASRDDGKGAS